MTQPRPFADSVLAYAQAGWPCILPVPAKKSPPPEGFTGADGADTDPATLAAWSATHAASSIALRMPDGVIGVDVDHYTKGALDKRGGKTLAEAIERWGPLPATWSSTARGDGWSRISFYRVPPGRYATRLGADVEIIQRHHRYAVVWPSPHPDTGSSYRWYDPSGALSELPPKPGELPELPAAWVAGLAEGAAGQSPAAGPVAAGEALLAAILAGGGPACAEIASATLRADQETGKAEAGSRHDAMTGRVYELVQLAAAGHPGLPAAVDHLRERWAELTAGEDRGGEFERMLLTAARKAVTATGRTAPLDRDPCLVIGSIPVAAPAPVDDRPEAGAPEPIEPPRALHPLEVIGTHLFDPRGHLDQVMAQAVLERTQPVLRYAVDAKTWLRRGPEFWEQNDALADWAVSLLAWIMPDGDPDAEKGSDPRAQADRRKRFMSAAPAGQIAKKLRSLVADSAHQCSLKVAELDREPWLLWAGGIGWDLRASAERPTPAPIDPATPHLHSAAVTPEVRPTPLWDAFTAAVWPDAELRAWALRVLSVAFTGYADKALPILVGETDRGKTQAVLLLMSVLGTYAHTADARLLDPNANAHASIVYALMGRRLSFIDEGPREGRLGQERLKQLTGGGDLTGNAMRSNPVTFKPAHTLILTANDPPILTDPAVRRRVRLVPCEGDPETVRATRAAIGDVRGAAWRREAPGVLAALMREAAAWLADPTSSATEAAPEAYRYRAEEIAADQDPVLEWVAEETEPNEPGERARVLYEAFVGWCKNGNTPAGLIPKEAKWGREVTRLGYPSRHTRGGKTRALRLRLRGGWLPSGPGDGLTRHGDGSENLNPSPSEAPNSRRPDNGVTGVTGCLSSFAHTHTHTRTQDAIGETPSTRHTANPPAAVGAAGPPPEAESAKITRRLLAAKAAHAGAADRPPTLDVPKPADPPAAPKRAKLTEAAKAAAKQAELEARIAEAAGPLFELPALVTRHGVAGIPLAEVPAVLYAFDAHRELTVDVETTGYPLGHADYALRTIQLGGEQAAVVLDACDPEQRAAAAEALAKAAVLHAHSATADLIPLAAAGVIADLEAAWARMHDTVIPAKLADPASTGSDPGLKRLAGVMLGDQARSPAADEARAALFKAGRWLTDVDATTPPERAGWAQADRRCETMIRYAASDVLDAAAIAKRLPAPPPAVLERERTAQRMTARITHTGVPLRREHLQAKRAEHRAALAESAAALRECGIDNPGSDAQVGARAAQLGAQLPRTRTGRLSVAKDALVPYKAAEGRLGELVRARLDYQHHETVLGLFLEPYGLIAEFGDGRVRPTVYTLSAATGRASSVRPNLQQLSRQGGVRGCIGADEGEVIVSADFAGVELRTMAALSQDTRLMAMLEAGVDVHLETAKQAYGPDAGKEDRYRTKRGVFGKAYGSGIPGIARTLGISEHEAAAIAASFDAMAPGLKAFNEQLKRAVQDGMRTFETYSGRVVHLDTRQPHKALNYLTQGTARELLVDALVRWQDTRWGDRVLMPVHDELLVWVPAQDAEAATAELVRCMESNLFGMPIVAEASEPSPFWKDAS